MGARPAEKRPKSEAGYPAALPPPRRGRGWTESTAGPTSGEQVVGPAGACALGTRRRRRKSVTRIRNSVLTSFLAEAQSGQSEAATSNLDVPALAESIGPETAPALDLAWEPIG